MEEKAVRLYQLALRLVPDADVAAELCIQARDEADLRRRAERWLAARGLPLPEVVEPLLELSPADREFACHLARRGRVRRRTAGVGAALVVLLLLAGSVAGLRTWQTSQPAGLPADPVYHQVPLVRSEVTDGFSLAVYRAEAVPGAVIVWWELRGPSAAGMAERLASEMEMASTLRQLGPGEWESTPHRENRLLGRAVFFHRTPPQVVTLRVKSLGLEVPVPLTFLAADPEAETFHVQQEVDVDGDRVMVEQVQVGRYATTVRVRFAPENRLRRFPRVLADEAELERFGLWLPGELGEQRHDLLVAPVPEGTERLRLLFQSPGEQMEAVTVEDPNFFQGVSLDGDQLTVTFSVEGRRPLRMRGFFEDDQGRAWWALISGHGDSPEKGPHRYRAVVPLVRKEGGVRVAKVDAQTGPVLEMYQVDGVERAQTLVRFHLRIYRLAPEPEVVIPLGQTDSP